MSGLEWLMEPQSAVQVLAKVNALGTSGWAVTDTIFAIKGSSDATKLARFEVDGLTTATTRTLTVPDASGTLALLSLAQTWSATQTMAAVNATSIGLTTPGSGAFTTLAASGVTTLSNDLAFTVTPFLIRANTSDGADNLGIRIASGGAFSTSRGACIDMYGNENASHGLLRLLAGDDGTGGGSAGTIQFNTAGTSWTMLSRTGVLSHSGTITVSDATDASAIGTASVVLSGGISVAKSALIGGDCGLSSGKVYKVNSVQVVAARDTGWTAMTGSPDKATAYATSTVTLAQLAGRVAQLQASLTTHGLIGA